MQIQFLGQTPSFPVSIIENLMFSTCSIFLAIRVRAALYTAFMTSTRKNSTPLRFFLGFAVAGIITPALLIAPRAQGQEQTPPNASDVADGMRLFEQKGNCQACHGWAGDGHKTDSQMPDGANLRETKLNRAGLVLLIKCGKLNSQMPAFDKFAYTDGRCYGKTQSDLKSYPTRMPDPPATLQQREIDLVVDFLIAKIVGKGQMNHAKCVEFWGSETDVCTEFPK
jgi:mono/diheme cytochrome c family protein